MKNFTLIVFILISNVLFSQSINVVTNSGWSKTISVSDIAEAGNDYAGTYVSSNNQTKITISPRRKNNTTVISIRKEYDFGDWHPNLDLQIKRTDINNSDSNGGLLFQTITDMDAVFFETKGTQKEIPLQYKINGISVLLPVQDYTTTIIFTVYND